MNNDLETLRHSCSHIMASAVKKLYPQAKLGIGPAIENGFYYDFALNESFKEQDLAKIEELMQQEIKQNLSFNRQELSAQKAIELFVQRGEKYKVELIKDLHTETVSVYQHGEFIDLCRGPHLGATGQVKHFKLLSTSGAYWRGDEKNDQLLRIYGTAFLKEAELNNYLKNLEEAKKRDHRVLGKELGLFEIFHDTAGAGLVFYLPKGAQLRRIIEDWEIREHYKRGYQMVNTPNIMEKSLWEKSGHLGYYKEYMYSIVKENQEFILKPMNCPGHILIYKAQLHSWRDLPLRMFELGTVYRYEKSGVLHGLLRVRGFTQDDAHIFCKTEDLAQEIEGVLDFVQSTMEKFGFTEFVAELSTRPDKFIGDVANWDLAENTLEAVLKKKNFNYKINPKDGAFYGPKIDIKLKDALGRQSHCATVQLDYNIPERFDLTYRAANGKDLRVVMIHRVLLGSLERFVATLIEHYAGKFPLWLAPQQVSVLTVSEEVKDYALEVNNALLEAGFRSEIDSKDETLPKKIRQSELMKIPYMVIIGKKEAGEGKISWRQQGTKNTGTLALAEFIQQLKKEV